MGAAGGRIAAGVTKGAKRCVVLFATLPAQFHLFSNHPPPLSRTQLVEYESQQLGALTGPGK